MSDVLDIHEAARTQPQALAIITPERRIDYAALAAAPSDGATVLRGTAKLATVLAIHAALAERRAIAPIAPDAPPGAEAERHERVDALPVHADTLVYIGTSGSIGAPKLVEISRAAYAAHALLSNRHLDLRSDDRWLVTLPFSHTGGLSILMRCLAARAAIVLGAAPAFGPKWAAWLAQTLGGAGVTRLSLVPAQLDLLVASGTSAPSSLRTVLIGGQAITPALAARAAALGWPLMLSYGLTETCGMCAATRLGDDLVGAGRALGETRFRAAEDLLEVTTPALATAVHGGDAFTPDGWLRTADRARIEGDLLTILGRADDVILSSGHKIDPIEIEAALLRLPFVRDAAVAGVEDTRYGSIVAALVVLTKGSPEDSIDKIELRDLDRHKRPRKIVLASALPRLSNGKLDRRAVQAALRTSP